VPGVASSPTAAICIAPWIPVVWVKRREGWRSQNIALAQFLQPWSGSVAGTTQRRKLGIPEMRAWLTQMVWPQAVLAAGWHPGHP